ncbi:membrane-associated kinase regulator 5-like isoform X2 [Andrographis paniculata]|nr:membrane-associated kinase regulator 5-like isoform X2 [Andrographis paniculata]XP_051143428.1 membrane-associated kinase regulator 5-like isoform X2 [Andrographis paniculata]
MDGLRVLKFWRNAAAAEEEARSDVGGSGRGAAVVISEDEETDGEDELFDLVLNSPNQNAVWLGGDGESKKDVQFVESRGDDAMRKFDFSDSSKATSTVTILRSAQKFKVKFVFGFGKSSKCEKVASNVDWKVKPLNQLSKSSSYGSSPKCRTLESSAPVFARDNSLRCETVKQTSDSETTTRVSSEKSVPKYMKLIKPFYIKVSKKVKLTDSVTPSPSPATAAANLPVRKLNEGSRLGSFTIVPRNLRKSRSASAAVGVDLPPSVRRRDDSLQQQHDGVQSAIHHCKKSYNSSSQEFTQPFQQSSDPRYEKSESRRVNKKSNPKDQN